MNDIEVKKEIDDIDDCLPELTKLLEEVKREEVDEDAPADVEEILKNFANDEAESDCDSADDADIQKLQELLKEKQRELRESEEQLREKSRKKRKPDDDNRGDQKRRKDNAEHRKSPTKDNGSRSGNIAEQSDETFLTSEREESAISVKTEKLPTEEELEFLLKQSDHSDEEPCNSNHFASAVCADQEVSVCTSPIQSSCAAQSADFYDFYNPSLSSFDVAHANRPEEEDELQCLPVVNNAGFAGMPTFKRIKLERPTSGQNEATTETTDETPKEKRQRIFSTCMALLERLEFTETSGKFIFTPTTAKLDSSAVCNSVLQNISNVHYDFQSIGPKLNLSDWGLKAIGGGNEKIAKAIGISAEAYFTKMKQKSDTIAGKLIKVEADRSEKKTDEELDTEEHNLSTFVKSSASQTEPLVCQKCAARNRIVSHDIGTQARVYSSSFGTQTSSTGSDNSELSVGLNEIQLKALYEFSHLIRGSSANSSLERFQARALDIYNILQSESKTLSSPYHASTRESSQDQRRGYPSNAASYPTHSQHPALQAQRPYSHDRTNLRPFPAAGASHSVHMVPQSYHPPNQAVPIPPVRDLRQTTINPSPPTQSLHSHGMPHKALRDPRQAAMNPSPPQAYWNPPPPESFNNYPPPGMPDSLRPPPNGNYPAHQAPPPTNYGYPPTAKESRVAYGRGHRL